ncbi:MAG TPA: hypothetical protein VK666_23870, partial [Chryseolinea sp.]|nr:hypothetical protein [Chryseolinea sp.]
VLITALTGIFNNNGICFWVYTKQRKLRSLLRSQHLFMPKLIPTRPGIIAWLIWMFIHLISLIGFKNKFFVLLSWLWGYFAYDKSNRLIIARPQDGVN